MGIYFISHVGGHKFAANLMIYRKAEKSVTSNESVREEEEGERKDGVVEVNGGSEAGNGDSDAGAGQCIWLARVRPEDCEGIVKFTVLQGKVVKPERQLRGGFDRGKGLVSW